VPEPLVRLAGVLLEETARWGDRVPLFSRDKTAEFLAPGWVCEVGRVRSELGWKPGRTLEQGLRETARWYRERGWLP
jgi:nucleoside-diphosphate-sugar epimerase